MLRLLIPVNVSESAKVQVECKDLPSVWEFISDHHVQKNSPF